MRRSSIATDDEQLLRDNNIQGCFVPLQRLTSGSLQHQQQKSFSVHYGCKYKDDIYQAIMRAKSSSVTRELYQRLMPSGTERREYGPLYAHLRGRHAFNTRFSEYHRLQKAKLNHRQIRKKFNHRLCYGASEIASVPMDACAASRRAIKNALTAKVCVSRLQMEVRSSRLLCFIDGEVVGVRNSQTGRFRLRKPSKRKRSKVSVEPVVPGVSSQTNEEEELNTIRDIMLKLFYVADYSNACQNRKRVCDNFTNTILISTDDCVNLSCDIIKKLYVCVDGYFPENSKDTTRVFRKNPQTDKSDDMDDLSRNANGRNGYALNMPNSLLYNDIFLKTNGFPEQSNGSSIQGRQDLAFKKDVLKVNLNHTLQENELTVKCGLIDTCTQQQHTSNYIPGSQSSPTQAHKYANLSQNQCKDEKNEYVLKNQCTKILIDKCAQQNQYVVNQFVESGTVQEVLCTDTQEPKIAQKNLFNTTLVDSNVNVPLSQCATVQIAKCVTEKDKLSTNMLVGEFSNVEQNRCADNQVVECGIVQKKQCNNMLVDECANLPQYQCANNQIDTVRVENFKTVEENQCINAQVDKIAIVSQKQCVERKSVVENQPKTVIQCFECGNTEFETAQENLCNNVQCEFARSQIDFSNSHCTINNWASFNKKTETKNIDQSEKESLGAESNMCTNQGTRVQNPSLSKVGKAPVIASVQEITLDNPDTELVEEFTGIYDFSHSDSDIESTTSHTSDDSGP